MDNLENAIGNILSDPEAMKKISELSKSLGLGNQKSSQNEAPSNNQGIPDLGMLSNLLNTQKSEASPLSTDPLSSLLSSDGESSEIMGKLMRFLPLLKGMNKEDDSTRLLQSLRPFLSEHKRKRLDDAAKMIRVIRLLPMLKNTGLF